MSKPWEEEWAAARGGNYVGPHHFGDSGWWEVRDSDETTLLTTGAPLDDAGSGEARARLASAAPDMARLLLELEWCDDDGHYCPSCGYSRFRTPQTHAPDCRLVAVLRKAGVRPE